MVQQMTWAFFEIFDAIDALPNKDLKIKSLKIHGENHQFRDFVNLIFNNNIVWTLPQGCPPYKENKEDLNITRGRLWQQFRLLLHFTNLGPYPDMTSFKRENIFLTLAETLNKKEVDLLTYVKDNRKLPQKTLSKQLFKEAFPDMAKTWEKPKQVV